MNDADRTDGGVNLTLSVDELAVIRACILETDSLLDSDDEFAARVGADRWFARRVWEKIVGAQMLVEPNSHIFQTPVFLYATQPIDARDITLTTGAPRGLNDPTTIDEIERDDITGELILVLFLGAGFVGSHDELILLSEKLENYSRYIHVGRFVDEHPDVATTGWRIEIRANDEVTKDVARLAELMNNQSKASSRRAGAGRVTIERVTSD